MPPKEGTTLAISAVTATLPQGEGILAGIKRRFKRFVNPLPSIGDTTYFYVEEGHWDMARLACKSGSRSSHCVLSQAIAERFDFPFVSTGTDGDVFVSDSVTSPEIYFTVGDSGVDVIEFFDREPHVGTNPEYYKPAIWPIMVSITRLESRDKE